MFRESEIHGDLLVFRQSRQKPYSVFFQIVDSVAMASLSLISQPEARPADEHRGEVLEQQRDRRGGVLGVELGAVALLLGAPHRGRDDVHAEAAELVLHVGESRLVSRPAGRPRS